MIAGPGWVVNSLFLNLMWGGVVKAFAVCVLLVFARLLLRRDWLAMAVVACVANVVTIADNPHLMIQIAFEVPAAAVAVWLLIRWGLLPMMVASVIAELASSTPITTDFTAWYAGSTLFVVTAIGGLAIAAFVTAMAGRPLFEDQLLEPRTGTR